MLVSSVVVLSVLGECTGHEDGGTPSSPLDGQEDHVLSTLKVGLDPVQVSLADDRLLVDL